MPGVRTSRAAAGFWSRWDGPSFMAIGTQDPDTGASAEENPSLPPGRRL